MMMEKYIAYESDKYFLEQLYKNLLVGVARLDVLYANCILFELSPCTKFVLTNWACASEWSCNPGLQSGPSMSTHAEGRVWRILVPFMEWKLPGYFPCEAIQLVQWHAIFFSPPDEICPLHFEKCLLIWICTSSSHTKLLSFFTWLLAAHTIRQENWPFFSVF